MKRFLKTPATYLLAVASFIPSLWTSKLSSQNSPQEQSAEREVLTTTTYWHVPEYNVIMRSTPCQAKTLCIDMYGVNADNPKLKDIFDGGLIDNRIVSKMNEIMRRPDGQAINSAARMCTAEFKGALRRHNNTWKSSAAGVDMTITPVNETQLKIDFDVSALLPDKTIRANRIHAPWRGACQ